MASETVRDFNVGASIQTLASVSLTPAANSLWIIVATASEPTDTYTFNWGISGGAESYTEHDGTGGTDDLELSDSFSTAFGDNSWCQQVWTQQFGATPAARTVTVDPDNDGTDILSGIGLVIVEITGHNTADPFAQTVASHSQDPPLATTLGTTTTFGSTPSRDQVFVAIGECNPLATFSADPTNWTEVDADETTVPYIIQVSESSTNTATGVTHDTATGSTYHFALTLFEINDAPIEGTATLTYGGSLTVTGTQIIEGTGTAAYGGTITATGTIPTNEVTGTAALDFGGSVTGTGTPTRLGTAALDNGGAVTGTGTATRQGTAAHTYGGSVATTGQPTRLGTTTADYGGSLTATGTIPTDSVTGTATLSYSGTTTSTGQATRLGTGSADYGRTLTSSGEPTRQGSAVVDYGGTVTANGVIPTGAVLGTATLAYGGTVDSSSQVTRQATVALTYAGTVAGAARVTKLGTATAAYGGSLTATGTISTTGLVTGTGSLSYAGQATATSLVTRQGTAALDYGGAVAAIVPPSVTLNVAHRARLGPKRHTARIANPRHTARIRA